MTSRFNAVAFSGSQRSANVDKRPRPSTSYRSLVEPVLLSDDEEEEPPRKRQRSTTPAPRSSRIEVISIPSSPNSAGSGDAPLVSKKQATPKSPWKNRPSWSKQTLNHNNPQQKRNQVDVSSEDDELARWLSRSSSQEKPANWTLRDDQRLRGLSIGRPSPNGSIQKLASHSTPSASTTRERLPNDFKFGPATTLKFNPNRVESIKHKVNGQHTVIQVGLPKIAKPEPNTAKKQLPRPPSYNTPTVVKTSSTPIPDIKILQHHSSITHDDSASQPKLHSKTHTSKPLFSHSSHRNPTLSITVPLTDDAKRKRERAALQLKLKQDTGYVKDHPESVNRILGLTGFSKEFAPNLDVERYRSAAQPKRRVIDRSQVSLDIKGIQSTPLASLSTKRPKFIHPKEQVKAILTDRFSEQFDPPLTFTNPINDRRLNGKFQFISDYVLGHGVKAAGTIGHPGCKCAGPCDETCLCLLRTFKVDTAKPKDGTKREWQEQVQQYKRRPDGLVVLRNDFIQRHMIYAPLVHNETAMDEDHQKPLRTEISECNDHCACDAGCINRVVQKGRTVPLDIFETGTCGFGIRSTQDLVRGQFIEVYLGEVITETELVRRENAAEAGSTSYIYTLDWFPAQQYYHVDGENFGSAMRFVNHSCDPNAGTFPVLNNKASEKLHYVAFFALKDIPAGTEITIDYTPQDAGVKYELHTADEGMELCHCKADNCRQMLWPPGKERKARKKIVGSRFD